MIILTEIQTLTALKCVSKTIARRKQDLRRITKKLDNITPSDQIGFRKIKKSILERKAVIQEFEELQTFLFSKLGM